MASRPLFLVHTIWKKESMTRIHLLPHTGINFITGFYSLIYTGYTNASNGTPWVCGPICSEGYTNGLRFASGASYMHAIENKAIYAAGIMAQAIGAYNEDSFDSKYKDYNPTFVTSVIAPMLILKPNQKHTIIFMAQISRDRAFKADTYKPQQELSQKYTDPI